MPREIAGHGQEEILMFSRLNSMIESIYFVQIVLNFFTEYCPVDEIHPIRDIRKIMLRYLFG